MLPEIAPTPEEDAVIEAAMASAAEQDGPLPDITPPDELAPVVEEPVVEEAPVEGEVPAEEVVEEPVVEPELTEDERAAAALEEEAKSLGLRTQKATDRFRELSAQAKQIEPLQQQVEQLSRPAEMWTHTEQFLEQNGLDLNTMGRALTMAAGIQSSDFSVLEKTAAGLEMELKNVYQKLGRQGGGYDPLAEDGNRDLREAVENGDVDQARALELAALRHKAQTYETQQRQSIESRQQQSEAEQSRAAAVDELNALGEEYTAIDPRFQEKAAILEPVMKTLFAKSHPSQWASLYRDAYKQVRLPAATAPAARATVPPLRNQPMRAGTTPASAIGDPEPSGMDDVMNLALKAAAARDGVPFRG